MARPTFDKGPHPWLEQFSHLATHATGSTAAFILAVLTILVWAVTGPLFGYSDTWQLVINTGTTIVTFLMVFLIQATQNRDSKAIHLKLDELLRAVAKARTGLVGLEHMSEQDLNRLEQEFTLIKARQARRQAENHPKPGRLNEVR